MGEDRARWDAKYAQREDRLKAPLPFIMDRLRGLPTGAHLLDLAAGDGRHAIPLARSGFEVTAVDVSPVGLERLQRFSEQASVTVHTHVRDLQDDDALFGLGPFAAALISFYKPPPWQWHPVARAVPPEGIIVLATFNELHAERTGFPRAYALEVDELIHPHPGMELVEYQRIDEGERSYDGYLWKRV